jgi:hypothetical protein
MGRLSEILFYLHDCSMPDKFDPYREALVMETVTIWPPNYAHLGPAERQRIESALHADAEHAANLQYERTHTGFCRRITVTDADLERCQG